MAVNTPLEIVESYIGLLIMQYLNKPNASGFIQAITSPAIIPQTTVQTLVFSAAPTSGTFVLSYNGNNTTPINWNDSAATIQSDLQALSGLSGITVAGSIASGTLTVTFVNVAPPALSLILVSNSLVISAVPITITITETDVTLPIAIQNAFNLVGPNLAAGAQLDILGQYVGVTRTGLGFTSQITLDDSDFYQLIQMAIAKNSAGSSLATIQNLIHQFFPGEIYVFDYKNMEMTYVLSQSIGSQDLIQLFVTEGLLPVPMGVGVTIIYPPSAFLFSFRTYELPSNLAPFNDYASYQTDWPWLSYQNAVTPP